MLVAIPSRGRPGLVKSQAVVPSARVYVPESEVEAYERMGTRNVVAVPDRVRGITATRNWILDHATHPRVVMVDDDVTQQGWARANPHTWTHLRLKEPEWLAEWSRLFDLAADLRFRIWGVGTMAEVRAVYPYRPLLFRSYVTASCMGMCADADLRFDESFPVKEDYELTLRCIRDDGGVLAARYLYWVNDHWTKSGGCREYRTQEMERLATERLMKMYPGMIRRVVRGGSEFSIQLDF